MIRSIIQEKKIEALEWEVKGLRAREALNMQTPARSAIPATKQEMLGILSDWVRAVANIETRNTAFLKPCAEEVAALPAVAELILRYSECAATP